MKDEITSTPHALEQFMDGSIHRDYQNELEIRISILRNRLEDPDGELNGKDYDLARGGLKVYREMEDLFDSLLANALNDLERGNEDDS